MRDVPTPSSGHQRGLPLSGKVMPKRVEDRQLTVRTRGSCRADRSVPEAVRLIKLELGTGAAIAANHVPSGDTKIIVDDPRITVVASSFPAERANSDGKKTFNDRECLHDDTFKAEIS